MKSPDADRAAQVTNAPDPARPAERAENPVEAPVVPDYADGIGFAAPDLEATLAAHCNECSAGDVHRLSDALNERPTAIADPIERTF